MQFPLRSRTLSKTAWRRAHFVGLGLIALLSAALGLLVGQTDLGESVNLRFVAYTLASRPLPLDPDLRVVTFERSPDQRKKMARFIDAMREAGARVLLFNVAFDLDGPPGPDLDLLQAAVARAADSQMWIVVPRQEVGGERKLNADNVRTLILKRTPFDNEHWKNRLAEGRDPGRLLIGESAWFTETDKCGIILHAVDPERHEELLHCAGFAVAAWCNSESVSPGIGEISQVGYLGMVKLANTEWHVTQDGGYLVRPIKGGMPPTETIDEALFNPAPYKDKLVLMGGTSDQPINSTILGEGLAPNFDAAIVNTLLQPAEEPTGASVATLIAMTVSLSLLAAFGSLGRLPFRAGSVHPAGSILLSLATVSLILCLAWYIPVVFFEQFREIVPSSPLLGAVVISSFAGWITAAKFSRGFEPTVLPDRFDGQATVLFVDLKSSTPLVIKVGATEAPKILGQFLKACTQAIVSNAGHVERTLGDGVLAVFFGPPIGKDDHAARALRAIESIQSSTTGLFREVAQRYGAETGFTAGIESGPLTMEFAKEPGGWSWQSFGPTVHLAKRLQEASSKVGHAIVVGPMARSSASGSEFKLVVIGTIDAKGFDEQIVAATLQFPDSSGKVTGNARQA
ncbi:MAG: hypothetical protein K1X67_08620 [Fimbriimonadaceae bacterium]|nr:hypothetical protein [Fimbriimonadaceae bacterium]